MFILVQISVVLIYHHAKILVFVFPNNKVRCWNYENIVFLTKGVTDFADQACVCARMCVSV